MAVLQEYMQPMYVDATRLWRIVRQPLSGGPVRAHLQLKTPQVIRLSLLWRAAKKCCEVRHRREVSSLRARRESPDRHVLDHALAQGADSFVGHGSAPVLSEVRKPQISTQDRPARYSAVITKRR